MAQSPRQGQPLQQFKHPLHQQREHGGRYRTFHNQTHVIQPDTGQHRLAVTAGAYQCAQRGGADVNHRRCLDPREYGAQGQRQFHQPQARGGRQPQGHCRFPQWYGYIVQAAVGVADDWQQAVQEQGRDGRHRAYAKQRNHEYQQRQRRDCLDHAGEPQNDVAQAPAACGEYAQRHGNKNGRGQRYPHQQQVVLRVGDKTLQPGGDGHGGGAAKFRGNESGGDPRFRPVLQLDRAVQVYHGVFVYASLQFPQPGKGPGMLLLGLETVDVNGLVIGKILLVVYQRPDVVITDLCIRGIQVYDVQTPGDEAAVGQVVIQSAHLLMHQVIVAPQSRPAVLAVHEFITEPQPQFRVAVQVGNGMYAQLLRPVPGHAQYVGVVEAQRRGHPYALAPQYGAQLLRIPCIPVGVDLSAQGPGIFRVDVDIAFQQGIPQHARAPEFAPVSDTQVAAFQHLCRQVAQDHALGELLGAYGQLRGIAAAAARQQQQRGSEGISHGGADGGGVRWACRKRLTNSSAGRSCRSW